MLDECGGVRGDYTDVSCDESGVGFYVSWVCVCGFDWGGVLDYEEWTEMETGEGGEEMGYWLR